MKDVLFGFVLGAFIVAFVLDGVCEDYTNGNCFMGIPTGLND